MHTGEWTQIEKARLYEALQVVGRDFSKVADIVQTRSAYQCRQFYKANKGHRGLEAGAADAGDVDEVAADGPQSPPVQQPAPRKRDRPVAAAALEDAIPSMEPASEDGGAVHEEKEEESMPTKKARFVPTDNTTSGKGEPRPPPLSPDRC